MLLRLVASALESRGVIGYMASLEGEFILGGRFLTLEQLQSTCIDIIGLPTDIVRLRVDI